MADRWEVRAAGLSSAPDHGGRAFARRGFAVALSVGLALGGVRCFQDLIVEPSQPTLNFTITPESTDVAIGDTVAPFRGSLTANGRPVPFRLRLGVTQGANVVRADSLARVAALARGVARLEARPLLSAFTSDTLRRTVRVRAIVPRLAVVAAPSVDTLTSLGDTLVLRAVALTRRGDTIPGVPVVWRRVSGDTAVTLLDSATGRARAARNGEAEFVASVDTATARRRVVVRQMPATVTTTDTVRLIALGQTVQLVASVLDRRGNDVANAAPVWTSADPGVCSVTASGVVTATANGSCRVEGRVAALADTTRVSVAQVARALRRVSGDGQSARVGTVLAAPFAVEVLDSLGAIVRRAGEMVRFVVTGGGGKLSGQDSLDVASDANGGASATLTLSTAAGAQTVSARLALLAASAVTFSATATPAPPRTLTLVSGDDQSGVVGSGLAAPFVVAVQDTFGNAVAGPEVWFKVTQGGGKLAGQDSVLVITNAQGQASATLTVGTVPATNRVTATSAGLVGSPLTFGAVAVAGPVRTLRMVSGNDQNGLVGAVLAEPFVVAAQDTFGNATAGRQIWFMVTRGGGNLAGQDSAVVATNAQGRASATLTLGTAPDTNRVTATSTELLSSPVKFSAVAVARQAYQLVKVSGDSQMAQVGHPTADPFVVAVRDTFGNAVGGTVVVFRIVAGGGRFAGVDSLVDTTDAVGLATALLTVSGSENDTTRITASVGGLVGSPVAFLAASAPIPVAQVAVAPRGASVSGLGATFQFTAVARDASGSVLPGRTFTWASLNPNVATTDPGTGVVTAVESGQATISATADGSVGYGLLTVAIPGAVAASAIAATTAPAGLAAIWGASAADIYAVGVGGRIARFDGTNWVVMASGTSADLLSVWGAAPDNIFAVGETILHYDGTQWRVVPNPTGRFAIRLWGSGPDDVYAVGWNDSPLRGWILHFDGSVWREIVSLNWAVLDIWGTSSSDVFAVGYGPEGAKVLHYDGSEWSEMPNPGHFILGVGGSSHTDVYAVGVRSIEPWAGEILHYDGTTWTAVTAPTAGVCLWDVWGSSASEVYAVGGDGYERPLFGAILRFDGTQWSALTLPTDSAVNGLFSVWGTSGSDPMFASFPDNLASGPIFRGVRGATVSVTAANPTLTALGATLQLTATVRDRSNNVVNGVSFTWSSSNSNVATVDVNGMVTSVAEGVTTISASAPAGATGSTLVTVALPAAASVVVSPGGASVSGVGATQAFTAQARDAAGNLIAGKAFAWTSLNSNIATMNASTGVATAVASGQVTVAATVDGVTGYGLLTIAVPGTVPVNAWSAMASGATQILYDVWGTSAAEVWAVASSGAILRYNGISWTAMTSGTSQWLMGVWGTSGTEVFAVGDGGTILRYNGTNWTAMTTGTSQWLRGVWGTSGAEVFAVGGGGTILRYDGASWRSMTSGTTQNLYGVWGTSGSEVFAVGDAGTVLRYNGTSWSSMTSGTSQDLIATWGTSGEVVFAVGNGGTILRYNGTAWTSPMSGTTQGLQGVWGSSVEDVFAVGISGTILGYNGTSWMTMASGTSQWLAGVWGTSAGELLAVGSAGAILRGVRGATVTVTPANPTLTSLGATVQLTPTARDQSNNVVSGVSFAWSSSNSAVATVNSLGLVTAVANGTATITATVPGGAADSTMVTVSQEVASVTVSPEGASISGVGTTRMFAADVLDANGYHISDKTITFSSLNSAVATVNSATGVATAVSSGQVTIRATADGVSGYALLTVAIPSVAAVNTWVQFSWTTQLLLGVWGTSSSNVYAVGAGGTILRGSGGSWSPMASGTTQSLFSIWGTSGSAVYAVGASGTIRWYNGSSWTTKTSGTTQDLQGVWGSSGSDIYAVGWNGTIRHYNGSSWSAMSGATGHNLNRIWGTSSSNVYAVGTGGSILRYNGSSWSVMTSGTSANLWSVWGTSSSNVYAVGAGGTILRYNGSTWGAMTSGTTQSLAGIWGTSASDIYAVGSNGTILHFNGTSWTTMNSGTTEGLQAVWGTSGPDVYVVGNNGIILNGVRL